MPAAFDRIECFISDTGFDERDDTAMTIDVATGCGQALVLRELFCATYTFDAADNHRWSKTSRERRS